MPGSRRASRQAGQIKDTSSHTSEGLPAALSFEQQSALLTAVFAHSSDGMAFFDNNFIIRAANETFARQISLPQAQILGRPGQDVMPGWTDQVKRLCREARSTGRTCQSHDIPHEFKDQPERGITYWDSRISPICGTEGRFLGCLVLNREVTELRRAEEERNQLCAEVEKQRQLLEGIIQNIPVGIAVLRGPDLVYDLVNPAFQSLAPGRDILGKSHTDLTLTDPGIEMSLFERILRTGAPERGVDVPRHFRRTPDGPVEEAYFSGLAVPLPEPGGKGNALLIIVNETTDQVLARKTVEELAGVAQRQASELRSILDNMLGGVLVCDQKGRITLTNQAGARVLGMDCEEEVKRRLSEFPDLLRVRHMDGRPVHPKDMPLVRALSGETTASEDMILYNHRARRDTYVRSSAAPIRNDDGKIVAAVAVSYDITELTELDRLKDQFIVVAAHELKTPVAIMKGYAQALLRTAQDLPPARHKMLDAIDRGADRINRIVKDLLDSSQLQQGRLEMANERIDLAQLVEEITDTSALTTTKHRINVVQWEQVAIRGDRARLGQVLTDLIDNAIRYSPSGGDIDIGVAVQGCEAVVSVTDRGVGIPRDKQAGVFQCFYRPHTGTPYDYGGMGVGLYISREVILRHGGRMWFESEEGSGSAFYFSVPLGGEHVGS